MVITWKGLYCNALELGNDAMRWGIPQSNASRGGDLPGGDTEDAVVFSHHTRNDVQMTADRDDAYHSVDRLAAWSNWEPFIDAAPRAPVTPGVYQMRGRDGTIVYVGMAGERKGQGIRGRLSIYRRGKGAVSGFGEAALDRALADATFIEDHLAAVRLGRPARTAQWAKDAISWLDVEVRWAECATRTEALALEHLVVKLLSAHALWNRVAARLERPDLHDEPAHSAQGLRKVSSSSAAHVAGDAKHMVDGVVTVDALTHEFGLADGGRAVRRLLRTGFPEHQKGAPWDPLSAAQVAYVRRTRLT